MGGPIDISISDSCRCCRYVVERVGVDIELLGLLVLEEELVSPAAVLIADIDPDTRQRVEEKEEDQEGLKHHVDVRDGDSLHDVVGLGLADKGVELLEEARDLQVPEDLEVEVARMSLTGHK